MLSVRQLLPQESERKLGPRSLKRHRPEINRVAHGIWGFLDDAATSRRANPNKETYFVNGCLEVFGGCSFGSLFDGVFIIDPT